jgi:hypothetical protein
MGIHQQINHKTVDPTALTDLRTGHEIMYAVSKMLWDVHNKEAYTAFHDYWVNSTPTKGIRVMRVRHRYTPEIKELLPKVHEMLAQYAGQYKVYTMTNTWLLGDVGYDEFKGTLLCVVLYYKSRPTKEYEYNYG